MNPDELLAEARRLLAQNKLPECIAKYEEIIRLVPDHPIPRAELAITLTQVQRLDEAEALAKNVLRIAPDHGVAEAAVGIVEWNRNRPDIGLPRLVRAVQLAPDLMIARHMLGLTYSNLGRFDEANECYEIVSFLEPAHPNARFSIAMHDLYKRRYPRGWHGYESRWLTAQLVRPDIPRPRWDGRNMNGRNLLVHTEQGIGDAVQLVRLLPLLKTMKGVGRLVFACQKPIHKLLENSVEVDEWFPIDQPATITFDAYTPMLSLPWLLGINEHNLPKTVPYVKPDPARLAKWKPIIEAIPGFKIGIGWQGSPTYIGDAFRSIPLRYFEKLAKIPGVSLVCLQRVNGVDQIAENKKKVPMIELEGLDADAAFVDTAAVLQYLDLTVCCDSALGHIAGAVAAPVWLGLSIGHDWRWQADREDTPWYPKTRLFRQKAFKDWDGVFDRMAQGIRDAMAGKATLAPPKPPVSEPIRVEVQAGELIDKITILELKLTRINDTKRRENVVKEMAELLAVRDRIVPASATLDEITKQLAEVNLAIWDNEERMRAWAKAEDFGEDYIKGARSIAKNNDRRAAIKRQINELLGSRLIEEKSYGA